MSDHTLIIAEAGVNHNGSVDLALHLVDAAADAGADVVKFQTFNTAKLVARHAPKARYQQQAGAADESQFEMVRRLELDAAAFHRIAERCAARGIEFLSVSYTHLTLPTIYSV